MHLLSLDAVGAGLVWQEVFFRQSGSSGKWEYRLILACAIWLAYVADRLFDTLSLNAQKATTARHAFIQKHRLSLGSIWSVLFVGIVLFSIFKLNRAEFIGGIWIVLLVNLYFLLLRLSKKLTGLGALKEILTGTLFALGVSYFPVLTQFGLSLDNLGFQVIFGLLCFTNVLLISHWESSIDKGQNERNLSQKISNQKILLVISILGLVCVSGILIWHREGILAWSVLLSTISLTWLFAAGRNKDHTVLPFLIDVPLMLPLLLFPVF